MHRPQHARDELVDTEALLHERHQRGDTALICGRASEVGEDELLERLDLVLERHKVGDGLVSVVRIASRPIMVDAPLVRVVDVLQTDVLLVLEQTVELSVVTVETQFGKEEGRVCLDQCAVSFAGVADGSPARLEPSRLLMCLLEGLP